MSRHRFAIAALVAAFALSAATLSLAQRKPKTDEDAPELYPAHPNRDDTFYACTACHSFKIVSTQGMSRERWDESLTWMVQRHNMPKIEGQQRVQVLDYLASAFPERRQPGGWKNPFTP